MNNVINLNKFRKKKKRDEAVHAAEENRAKFGRTKAEKKKETTEKEQASTHLDAHKRDDT